MSKKLLIPAIVAALVLAGWLCYYFSDKMVIRRQFAELAQDLAKAEQEQPIQMALKMGRVKTMLAGNNLSGNRPREGVRRRAGTGAGSPVSDLLPQPL